MTLDRTALLEQLGFQRLRILSCLGGDLPHSKAYFDPDPAVNIFTSFRLYTERLSREWSQETDRSTVALLAAGRLLAGEISAADLILENLPAHRVRLDQGAGICMLAPFQALSAALPLPSVLRDSSQWLAGSDQQALLRGWLSEHRSQLRWEEFQGVYVGR
jgi:hypothetical protein